LLEPGAPPVHWHKSTASASGACVEVAIVHPRVLVRDSKDRTGPVISVSATSWAAFIATAKEGLLDPPNT
jgi:hypothetical protein